VRLSHARGGGGHADTRGGDQGGCLVSLGTRLLGPSQQQVLPEGPAGLRDGKDSVTAFRVIAPQALPATWLPVPVEVGTASRNRASPLKCSQGTSLEGQEEAGRAVCDLRLGLPVSKMGTWHLAQADPLDGEVASPGSVHRARGTWPKAVCRSPTLWLGTALEVNMGTRASQVLRDLPGKWQPLSWSLGRWWQLAPSRRSVDGGGGTSPVPEVPTCSVLARSGDRVPLCAPQVRSSASCACTW
jgi:hypothetical protein